MARTDNLTNFLTDVSGAIKAKLGDDTPISAEDFDIKIADIPSGGGSAKYTNTLIVGTSTSGYTQEQVDYLCDGTADEVEINQAIADAMDGTVILILAGKYTLASSILVNKSNVAILGQVRVPNLTELNINIGTTFTGFLPAFSISSSSVLIEGVRIQGSSYYMDILSTSSYVKVARCQFTDSSTASSRRSSIQLYGGCHDIEISDNEFYQSMSIIRATGISADLMCKNITVTGNSITQKYRSATTVVAVSYMDEINFSRNKFKGQYNVSVSSSIAVSFTNNVWEDDGATSARLSLTSITNCLIEGNFFLRIDKESGTSVSGDTVVLNDVKDCVFSNNTFDGQLNSVCVNLAGNNFRNVSVSNNTFNGCQIPMKKASVSYLLNIIGNMFNNCLYGLELSYMYSGSIIGNSWYNDNTAILVDSISYSYLKLLNAQNITITGNCCRYYTDFPTNRKGFILSNATKCILVGNILPKAPELTGGSGNITGDNIVNG